MGSSEIKAHIVAPKSKRDRVIVSARGKSRHYLIRVFGGECRIYNDLDTDPRGRAWDRGETLWIGGYTIREGGGGVRIYAEPRGNWYSRERARIAVVAPATPEQVAAYNADPEPAHALGEAGAAVREASEYRAHRDDSAAELERRERMRDAMYGGSWPDLKASLLAAGITRDDRDGDIALGGLLGNLGRESEELRKSVRHNEAGANQAELKLYRALYPDPYSEYRRRAGLETSIGTPTPTAEALAEAEALAAAEREANDG